VARGQDHHAHCALHPDLPRQPLQSPPARAARPTLCSGSCNVALVGGDYDIGRRGPTSTRRPIATPLTAADDLLVASNRDVVRCEASPLSQPALAARRLPFQSCDRHRRPCRRAGDDRHPLVPDPAAKSSNTLFSFENGCVPISFACTLPGARQRHRRDWGLARPLKFQVHVCCAITFCSHRVLSAIVRSAVFFCGRNSVAILACPCLRCHPRRACSLRRHNRCSRLYLTCLGAWSSQLKSSKRRDQTALPKKTS